MFLGFVFQLQVLNNTSSFIWSFDGWGWVVEYEKTLQLRTANQIWWWLRWQKWQVRGRSSTWHTFLGNIIPKMKVLGCLPHILYLCTLLACNCACNCASGFFFFFLAIQPRGGSLRQCCFQLHMKSSPFFLGLIRHFFSPSWTTTFL